MLLAASVLTGCISSTPAPSKSGVYLPKVKDTAPTNTGNELQRLARLPDPVVTDEPKSRGGNGPVYEVLGKRYRVMEDATNFVQIGTASWYGMKFHGRNTSNGERFDIYKLTAAHKHLPLPSFVRVTNLANNKQTVVRVNDRGPFHGDRIIDLSYAAAVKLGFHDKGTAQVRIEVLKPTPPKPEANGYLLQAGAFSDFTRASQTQDRVAAMTGERTIIVKTPHDHLYRVQVGPLTNPSKVQRLRTLLEGTDLGTPRVIEMP